MEFGNRLVQFSIPDAIKQRAQNFIFFINTLTSFQNDYLFEDFDFFELSSVDNTFICDSCTGSSICQICVEIEKYIICDVNTSNTTPCLTNELEFTSATITTILKAIAVDL